MFLSAIWDRYLEFESQVGDLPSILKVDSRRRDALQQEYANAQTLLLIDRYKFIDLIPCSTDQLKLLGYQVVVYFIGIWSCIREETLNFMFFARFALIC